MNYVIFDLEYNQINRENYRLAWTTKTKKPHDLKFEILQIGAIKVDENLKYVSNFKMYVKPKFLPKINEHVLDILNVSEDYIRINGLYFDKVFEEFKNFIGQDDCTLVTWSGDNDIGVLESNLEAWKMDFNINKFTHIDLQQVIMQKEGLELRPSLGKIALEYEIDFDASKLHDAYADASVTKQLFQKIGIKEVSLHNTTINFRYNKELFLKNKNILVDEFKKIPHCNKCGKFIKTSIKTDIYINYQNIMQVDKMCYCDKCNLYVFKNYKYNSGLSKLTIKDVFIHGSNNEKLIKFKKKIDFIKNIERIQLKNNDII